MRSAIGLIHDLLRPEDEGRLPFALLPGQLGRDLDAAGITLASAIRIATEAGILVEATRHRRAA